MLALPAAAGPIDWAHQKAGAVQSNGAVTVKSLSGGSYSATGNPSGAVAKVNQNAVTQPPTVIIQATSGNYAQAIPLLVASGNNTVPTIPTCPSGYNSVFTQSGVGVFDPVYNVAGTRWSLSYFWYSSSGTYMIAWYLDGNITGSNESVSSNAYGYTSRGGGVIYSGGTYRGWAANLCTK